MKPKLLLPAILILKSFMIDFWKVIYINWYYRSIHLNRLMQNIIQILNFFTKNASHNLLIIS